MVYFKKRIALNVITYTGLLCGSIYAGFPVLWMFFSSLKSNTEIFSLPPTIFPKVFTIASYDSILSSPVKIRFFINSYVVSFSVTLLTLFVAIMAGYSFSRYHFKFRKPLSLIIISTQTVPPITLLIPYFSLVVTLKLYNTYMALILTYMAFTLPYAILMMTGYFNTLPTELDEAVLMDGGSCFSILWKFLVPISIPGIIATGVYTFILSYNEFLFCLDFDQNHKYANRTYRYSTTYGATCL